ncbi:MAG TPA: SH3 domain-containing protein [Dyella sp.]|nr:SH3 domain-containing protein [Dyella sp.]
MTRLAWLSFLFLLAFTAAPARAADGYVTASVNLRAGPDIGYPRIATIPVGYDIRIFGCTAGWGWCDVGWRGDRGWVAGSYIEFYDDGYYQPLTQYGPRVGIPIVTFAIALYWSNHYSHRPFYRERDYWYARPIPHRPPPPAPHRPWHRPRPRPDVPSPGAHRPLPPAGDGHRAPPPQPRPMPQTRPQPAARPAPRPQPEARPQPRPAPATHPTPRREQGHGKPEQQGRGKPADRKRDDHGGH